MMSALVLAKGSRFPSLGLLALAATLGFYMFSQLDGYRPPILLTGSILLAGGAVQLLTGISSRQQGRVEAAVTLLPLGIFWLSLISYQVFPALGLGRQPNALTMFSFLSLWGLFMAVRFLGSFRQSLAVQILYGTMMFSFLALAMDYLRTDQVFLIIGCTTGILASGVAGYMALAQFWRQLAGREILPLGGCSPEEDDRQSL